MTDADRAVLVAARKLRLAEAKLDITALVTMTTRDIAALVDRRDEALEALCAADKAAEAASCARASRMLASARAAAVPVTVPPGNRIHPHWTELKHG